MLGDSISNDGDLVAAVKDALIRNGSLSQIKAKLRAEVYHALEDKTQAMPEKPKDVFLVSELIRDYLICTKHNCSLSVFCEESGQPMEMNVDREFLGAELGVNTINCDKNIPLLLLLVHNLVQKKEQRELDQVKSITNEYRSDDS